MGSFLSQILERIGLIPGILHIYVSNIYEGIKLLRDCEHCPVDMQKSLCRAGRNIELRRGNIYLIMNLFYMVSFTW